VRRVIGGIGISLCLALVLSVSFGRVSAKGQAVGGSFVYVVNNASFDLDAYAVDATTGDLTLVSGAPYPTGVQPVAVTVDPTGRFVYVVDYNNIPALGFISAWSIDGATGALTPVPGSPFPTGFLPRAITIDSTGHFAYVANSGDNNVSAYTINGITGALAAIPGSPFPAGSRPYSVTASGSFLYVANNGSNDVSAYTIDSATGALTAVPSSPFSAGTGPYSVTATGQFAYVANLSSNDISAYTIDSVTGALAAVPGSPFPTDVAPSSVVVDPTGHFAYVANCGELCNSNDLYDRGGVSAYTIDATTGALTAIPDSWISGNYPNSLAVLPSGGFLFAANCGAGCAGDGAFLDPGSVSAYSIDGTTGELTEISRPSADNVSLGVAATVAAAAGPPPGGIGLYPAMSESPDTLAFGSMMVGSSSAPQTVVVSNTGTAPLQLSSISTTGDFSETTVCSSVLAPGASCAINVVFTPRARFARTGTLVISSSQISQTDTVTLSGTGMVAIAQLSPGSLNFVRQRVNTPSASQYVTLVNAGDGPLTLSGIITTGAFSQTSNCGSSVAPGAGCNIAVTFTPRVHGVANGTLSIAGNQQGSAPVVSLTGSGFGGGD
jgi:6-phosphogluconolactonase (cycloisomerase 2 family)